MSGDTGTEVLRDDPLPSTPQTARTFGSALRAVRSGRWGRGRGRDFTAERAESGENGGLERDIVAVGRIP
jgi:hypothetical protein